MSNFAKAQKYVVNAQEGVKQIERASITFILAASASNEHETIMFATSDAVELLVKGAADGLVYQGMPPITDLFHQYVANGGRIYDCGICAKTKNITDDDLIEGAEIAGAPKVMEFLEDGGKVLA